MKRLSLLIVVFCVLSFNSQARSLDHVKQSGFIKVAVYSNFAPYSYIKENGEVGGIDVELAMHIARSLGVKLQLSWTPADENVEDDLRNNLWKGHLITKQIADVMLRLPYEHQYMEMRDDQGEKVHDKVLFFAPYQSESWLLAHNVKRLPDVPNLAYFRYHKIAVEVDSVPQFYLTSAAHGQMRSNTLHFPSMKQAFSSLAQGEVDAVLGLAGQVQYFFNDLNSKTFKLSEQSYPMMGKPHWNIGMAVKSSYPHLARRIDKVVQTYILSGDIRSLYARYHHPYPPPSNHQMLKTAWVNK